MKREIINARVHLNGIPTEDYVCELCGEEAGKVTEIQGFHFCDSCHGQHKEFQNGDKPFNYVVFFEQLDGSRTDSLFFYNEEASFDQFFTDASDNGCEEQEDAE